jgi:hypothetical protein
MPAMDDRAHEKPCTIIHPPPPPHGTTIQLDALYTSLAHQAARNPDHAPGTTIVDCSSLVAPETQKPALYCVWVTRISTPGIFSITCVGEHLRKHFVAGDNVIMSIFNDYGISGVGGEEDVVAGTYMIVFKRIEVEKMRCVPVNFSTMEKKAIKEYTVMCDESPSATIGL